MRAIIYLCDRAACEAGEVRSSKGEHMSHRDVLGSSPAASARRVAAALAAAGSLVLLAACGDADGGGDRPGSAASPSPSASDSVATLPEATGTWLVGITSAGGDDAETTSVTYVSYDPSTGTATARKVPGVVGGTGDGANAALLVSTDRRWAVPDLDVARAETSSGQVTLWSTRDQSTKRLDLRRLTGQQDLRPVAHAFDPQRPEVLRVVDSRDRVWAVDVATGKAASEGRLTQGPFVFTNGFNHNTGIPWVESIDSDATRPAGNGVADTAPVQRAGGTVLPSDGDALAKLPKSPCRLGGAFTTQSGTTWLFCADAPQLTTYALPSGGTQWQRVGKPSTAVAPDAAGVPLVLPPVD